MTPFSILLALSALGAPLSPAQTEPAHFFQEMPSEALQENWVFYFLKELFHKRIEQCVRFEMIETSIASYASIAEVFSEETYADLMREVNAISLQGFSDAEFQPIKQATLERLSVIPYELSLTPPLSTFLRLSQNAIEEMDVSCFSTYWETFLCRYLEPAQDSDMSICFADNTMAQEIPTFLLENPTTNLEPFYTLPLGEKEKKMITELVSTIAEKNIFELLFKKRDLEKLGKKINHVHPMRFISYILSEPKLKKHLKEIRSSSFKWDHFIGGFANRMKEENSKNNLIPYVPGMADLLQIQQNLILNYLYAKDYKGMVKSLI